MPDRSTPTSCAALEDLRLGYGDVIGGKEIQFALGSGAGCSSSRAEPFRYMPMPISMLAGRRSRFARTLDVAGWLNRLDRTVSPSNRNDASVSSEIEAPRAAQASDLREVPELRKVGPDLCRHGPSAALSGVPVRDGHVALMPRRMPNEPLSTPRGEPTLPAGAKSLQSGP